MRPFSVPHAMRLRGKKEIFRYRCDLHFRRIRVSSRLAGIISFFGRRFVMPTSSAVRPPAPRLLWYSRVKCGSYLGANEDRFFNWRTKVKFALFKTNKLRHILLVCWKIMQLTCVLWLCFRKMRQIRDSALLSINFINALNLRMIIDSDDTSYLFVC